MSRCPDVRAYREQRSPLAMAGEREMRRVDERSPRQSGGRRAGERGGGGGQGGGGGGHYLDQYRIGGDLTVIMNALFAGKEIG